MHGLWFVPPRHAGDPPIVSWKHWHSKESYESILKDVSAFIHSWKVRWEKEAEKRINEAYERGKKDGKIAFGKALSSANPKDDETT